MTAILGAVSGCRPDRSELDLVDLFPFTERGQEVQEIDLGTPSAEPHLTAGWSNGETLPSGESIARAVARRATVRFTIREPTDGRAIVRCGIPDADERRMLPVIVSLNRRRVGALRLRRELEEHTLRLPARAQRAGTNELVLSSPFLSFAAFRARRRVPVMACDLIRLEGINDDADRAVVVRDDDGAALRVPPDGRVDFYLRVPASAALAFDLSNAGAGLRVTLQAERGEERVLYGATTSTPSLPLDLSDYHDSLVRLSFEATGETPVTVREPRVLARAAADAARSPINDLTRDLAAVRRDAPRPNILLYVIDTLRADHLGSYGYRRPTSPNIDQLAADGWLFENTIAQASWTTPATASILTGRYPISHGALSLGEGPRQNVPTLAEMLREAGYRTGAFVTNGNVSGSLGFRRGFDDYVYLPEDQSRPTVHVPADQLHAQVLSWLHTEDRRPFFLYVHATDPHAPYAPPDRWVERFRPPGVAPPLAAIAEPVRAITRDPALRTPENIEYLTALYDAEIAFTDENIGQLIRELQNSGLYERTLIVLTADHGEELYEHGRFGHGHSLYREQTRVPLVLRLPGGVERGRRVTATAEQIDIVPTVLEVLGLPQPDGVSGSSLLHLAEHPDATSRDAFSDTRLGFPLRSAVVSAGWKVIEIATPRTRFEVYDLAADPTERNDLAADAPVILGYGRQALAEWAAKAGRVPFDATQPASNPMMDEQTKRRLEALGYVNQDRRERQ